MRRQHFESLRPICPVCRSSRGQSNPLVIATVEREEGSHVIEGVLHCSDVNCQREYPIIDGIPLIIENIRGYISENVFPICYRDDLSAMIEGMLGDCCGAGAAFDVRRQHLSSYTRDHYGEFDPEETSDAPPAGSVVRVLKQALELVGEPLTGPILDLGCSVGRSSFELAEQEDQLVLGIDLNFSMLQVAARALRSGSVTYPRRRVGLVYDRRRFPIRLSQRENVDFWACDVTALPFSKEQFGAAVGLNTLDCLASPFGFLSSLKTVLRGGSKVVLSCPYDWSASATPLEGWLGGHSQRGPDAGGSESVLRRLLTPGSPQSVGLELLAESDADWHVRLHDRSTVLYKCHLMVAAASTN